MLRGASEKEQGRRSKTLRPSREVPVRVKLVKSLKRCRFV
jgi:hypothetical protein